MQNILLVITGPTGTGKTDVSVSLASHFSTEIISCDSRQFYKELRIGSCFPSPDQLERVKHHFVGNLSVTDYYSASLFERDALRLLGELFRLHRIVIMAGGSGMYSDAVCEGIDDIPDVDPAIRDKYTRKYMEEGIESLRVELRILDPEHYGKVDLRNYKRIIRALEICETTGRPYSSFMKHERRKRDFIILKLGLARPREELFDRINRRVDAMISQGLEKEARSLIPFRHMNALNTVGYKELFACFDGSVTFEKAVELIKRNTRRYAKRQMTWWTRDSSIKWFHPGNLEGMIEWIKGTMDASITEG